MKLLYIDACPRRGGVSRTRQLAQAFLSAFEASHADVEITTHDVAAMGLAAINDGALREREALIDERAWTDALFAPAMDFRQADWVVVAAPYWDLMFPAMLKVYIEHVCIRELTFRYVEDVAQGLCRARQAIFLTTAGSPIAGQDFGTLYLRAVLRFLGIEHMEAVAAEGLDVREVDAQATLREAMDWARKLARQL